MSEGPGETIIIRKRRSDGDEDHHGGVWKLAFADFMTAMMAFFLVMWLINSTSKETKAVIVQYFNPVQLIDANPAHKGLRDPKVTGQGKSLQHSDSVADTPSEKSREAEAALHRDPIKTLNDIAQRERPEPEPAATAAPRDPFDRAPRKAAPTPPPEPPSPEAQANDKAKPDLRASLAAEDDPAKALAAVLQSELEKAIKKEQRGAPRVEIAQTDEGLLISLTDDANFSMFSVGSIEPRPQLVRIIAQIGALLAKQNGEIELRGHTDGRSYAGAAYDNWRLSSDRATVVNYMLIRGGLPTARVGKIVGLADRRLKTPKDPLAAVNRRIEILLRGEGR